MNKLTKQQHQLLNKCNYIIFNLKEDALEEANENLESLIEYYQECYNYTAPEVNLLPDLIKGKVLSPKIRPSLTLDT